MILFKRYIVGVVRTPLLAISPLLDETTLTAESHQQLIESTLQQYNRDVTSLQFIVGDNCNLNKRIATNLNKHFVGCASHRLNLAAQRYYDLQRGDYSLCT